MYAENFKILIKNGKCNTMNKILCSLSKTIDSHAYNMALSLREG